jgi:hypothetical protein
VATLNPAYNGTAGGQNAYTGYGVARSGWRKVIVDLSVFASNPAVTVRWVNFADGDAFTGPGWYIDDVHVFDVGATVPGPKTVDNPTPPDGAIYAPPQSADFTNGVVLAWDATLGAATYDVYVGSSATAVANATTASAEYRGNVAVPQYTATFLTAGNTYYWRVDSVGSSNTAGFVWSFGTSNPVPVFINEVQTYGGTGSGPYVEIYNPGAAVTQDIQGWDLNATSGGANLRTATLPRILLGPGQVKVFVSSTWVRHQYINYRAWDTVNLPFNLGWTMGTNEGETWLRDPGGNGVDYMGFNVTTSNRPADLNWSGSLDSTMWYYSIWRRTNNTDTDSASDFRRDYYTYYNASYGYMGEKDAGQ